MKKQNIKRATYSERWNQIEHRTEFKCEACKQWFNSYREFDNHKENSPNCVTIENV